MKRNTVPPPRTFDHFPEDLLCPVCSTNDDGPTVLVPIDGTQNDHICEATPVHLACAVCDHHNRDMGVMYRRCDGRV